MLADADFDDSDRVRALIIEMRDEWRELDRHARPWQDQRLDRVDADIVGAAGVEGRFPALRVHSFLLANAVFAASAVGVVTGAVYLSLVRSLRR